MSDYILNLDPSKRSTDTIDFQTALRGKIVGQEEGVQALVDLYQVFRAGLNSPGRPVGNLLFLGPTGSGKTRIVEAAAEILFGEARAVIKIDCAEFQHSHEIAKLIGSPPGYLGHRETHPLITQETLAASHNDKLKLSFLLFDEIEKASDALWQLLLGMLDKATLTLGDNRKVDLSQTVIFLTSNLGGGEIADLMHGGMGFVQPGDKPVAGLDEKVERTAVEAARRKFSPEFMNRLDKVVVFHPLQREQLQEVLNIELGQVQQRVLDTAKGQFLFRVTDAGRDFLLQEGTDQRYGARHRAGCFATGRRRFCRGSQGRQIRRDSNRGCGGRQEVASGTARRRPCSVTPRTQETGPLKFLKRYFNFKEHPPLRTPLFVVCRLTQTVLILSFCTWMKQRLSI